MFLKQDAKGFANAIVVPDDSAAVKKERGGGGGGAGSSSGGAGVVEGLEEVMVAAKQMGKYEAALAWCKAQGVTTVEMLQEVGGDELAAPLGLQPIPAAFLLRKIREGPGSEPAEGPKAAAKRPAQAEPEGDHPGGRQRS